MSSDLNQNATPTPPTGPEFLRPFPARPLLALLMASAAVAFVAGPAWSSPYSPAEIQAVESPQEREIRQIREQEVTQLRITLGRRNEANRRADLYFRLAEIYLEAYRMEYQLEGRAHEKRFEMGGGDRAIDHTRSRPYLEAGIKACNEILRLGIPYPKMDQVHFFLGFNHAELGKREEALRYFETLTRNYPQSPFAGEAYRQLGEAAYAANAFAKAQGHFEYALAKSPESAKPGILHKLAWTNYRLRQFDRAIAIMKDAVALATRNGEKFLNVREEALRDMALFMTESGRVEEAIVYFQNVAGDKTFYPKVLERLGKQYERNVEPAKATQVYESLLKTHPQDEAAFRVLAKLVDLDLRRGMYREALGRLGRNFKIPRGGEGETQIAAQNLRAMIRRAATENHEAFRKKGERSSLEIAEACYTAYLEKFLAQEDSRAETPEIRMYLAEVKRELGKSDEASALYRAVVESRDKRYAKEAGALWTASLADAIQKQGAAGRKTGAGAAAGEPSPMEREFVSAADQLGESLGESAEAREASLRAAQVLAGYKSSQKEALKRIRKLISNWPKSVQALTGARLWVQLIADRLPPAGVAPNGEQKDAMEDLKDLILELRKNAELLAADKELGASKLSIALSEQETRLKIGAIATAESEKDFTEAAKGYEALATESAQRDLAEKAYENAVASYLKEANIDAAMRVSANWLKRYPRSPKALDSIRYAATANLIQGKFESALGLFEKLGREGGDADALETAARLAEAVPGANASAEARARQLWSAHLELFPKAAGRWRVALTLARSQDAARQDGEAVRSYRLCMGGPAEYESECALRLSALYAAIGNAAESRSLLEKLASRKKPEGPAAVHVGHARYLLAEALEKDARFEPLAPPEAQLKKSLNQRLAFLEPLSRAYQSAVEAGGPWAIAALDRLALWAFNFADEIDRIPGSEAFRKNLASVSGPLRNKAQATWKESYQRATGSEVLSPSVIRVADRLGIHAQGSRGGFAVTAPSVATLAKVRERLTRNPQDDAAWNDYGSHLWSEGNPGLARIAFDRAASLNPKSAQALNNRAVALLGSGADAPEDWNKASEASELLARALELDPFFNLAKANRARLLNYYRLFAKSKPLWEQLEARMKDAATDPAIQDGLAVALQGGGELARAQAAFEKATGLGAPKRRFAVVYHDAARLKEAKSKCVSRLEELDEGALEGFEKSAVQSLKEICEK